MTVSHPAKGGSTGAALSEPLIPAKAGTQVERTCWIERFPREQRRRWSRFAKLPFDLLRSPQAQNGKGATSRTTRGAGIVK